MSNSTYSSESPSTAAVFFILLVKWRRLLVINFIIFFVIGLVVSLMMPKWYKAETSILPSDASEAYSLASMLNPLKAGPMSFLGGTGTTMSYISILNSRTVREAAVRKFNLIELLKCKDVEIALRKLDKMVKVDYLDIQSLIKLEVMAKSPRLAADLANFFMEELDRLNTQFSTEKASANRKFLEARVAETFADLTNAEDNLSIFQEKNGAYAIDEQTKAMIETAAALQAQIYQIEVEIEVLEGSVKKNHPELMNKRVELRELKKKMDELQSDFPGDEKADFQIPFDKIPEIGVQYIRLLREVEARQMILELLLPQLELAKLEEVKNTPSVQVLDKAQPPLRKAKPKRARVTLFIAIIGTIFTLIYIIIFQRWDAMRNEDKGTREQLTAAFEEIRSDILFWRRKAKK